METVRQLFDSVRSDLRHGIRSYMRSRSLTYVAVATLTIGVSFLTAIFSFINAAYFRPLPYPDAKRIVALSEESIEGTAGFSDLSLSAAHAIRSLTQSLERVAVYQESQAVATIGDEPRQLPVLRVDTAFQALLQLKPQLGRLLTIDDVLGDHPSVLISDSFWRSRFGMDSSIVGTLLSLDGRLMRIVGILPEKFGFPYQTAVVVPLVEATRRGPSVDTIRVSAIARLRPGIDRLEAQADLKRIAPQIPRSFARQAVQIVVRKEMLDRRAHLFAPFPGLFFSTASFVLLIACLNVANLLLVRNAQRRGEMALRASLGASRSRLIRQLFVESVLLAGAASVLACVLAPALVRLGLGAIPTSGFPSWYSVAMDWRILSLLAGVGLVVAIAVTAIPAREATRFDLTSVLKGSGEPGTITTEASRFSRYVLVSQLSLSLALFIGAALMLRSYVRLANIDLGYPARDIGVVRPFFDQVRYPDAATRATMVDLVRESSTSLPGMRIVTMRGAVGTFLPGPTRSPRDTAIRDVRIFADFDTSRMVNRGTRALVVTADYFRLLGMRTRAGRVFNSEDNASRALVAVVSSAFARSAWGDANAIGRNIQIGAQGQTFSVIGVVSDVRDIGISRAGLSVQPAADVYLSQHQTVPRNPEIVFSGSTDVAALRRAVVGVLRSVAPDVPVLRAATMASGIESRLFEVRLFGSILGVLAGIALLLALVGVYGVVTMMVAARTREIGIRLAIGGAPGDIVRRLTFDCLPFLVGGIVAGIGLALALGQLLRALLVEASSLDPATYGIAALGFGVVALLGCYLPARRAANVDPVVSLRAESLR